MKQQRVSELPDERAASVILQNDALSEAFPSLAIAAGSHRLHVLDRDGEWEVWLNTEAADFDGLCLSAGLTRQAAVAEAVNVLEAALEQLQQPPW